MAVDSAGNVYVAEYSNHRVQKFSSNGALLGGSAAGAAQGMANSSSPPTSRLTPNVYVADNGNNRVQRFAPSRAFSAKWGTSGTGDGQFIGAPGLALASAGGVYVADFQNRRIQKFSIDGAFLERFGDASIFNRPIDVAERSGNLYVADYGGHTGSTGSGRRRLGAGAAAAQAPTGIGPPVLGSTVNVKVVGDGVGGGACGVGGAGGWRASQKGLVFVPLTAERQVPVGSFLDTRRGTVELVSATGSGQKTQAGRFNAGLFQVMQSRARARGLTELRLKGSGFSRCRARGGGAGAGARARSSRGARSGACARPRRAVSAPAGATRRDRQGPSG